MVPSSAWQVEHEDCPEWLSYSRGAAEVTAAEVACKCDEAIVVLLCVGPCRPPGSHKVLPTEATFFHHAVRLLAKGLGGSIPACRAGRSSSSTL